MLKGTHEEVEDMLKNIGSGSKTVNELSSQLIIMKKLVAKKICQNSITSEHAGIHFKHGTIRSVSV